MRFIKILPFKVLLLLFASLLINGCSEEENTPGINYSETGIFTATSPPVFPKVGDLLVELSGFTFEKNNSNTAVSSVKLIFSYDNNTKITYSEADGSYAIFLPVGDYTVKVEKAGYNTWTYNGELFRPDINSSNIRDLYLDNY